MGDKIVCSNRKLLVNIRFDFDIIMSTNNRQIINGAYKGIPVTYDKHPIKKEVIDKTKLYKYDERAFDTKIGFITNISTSLYTMLNDFNENSIEYNKIIKRLKILRKEQGQEIDKTKGATTKPFPKWWTHYNSSITAQDNEDCKIVVTKRPYFMRYLYNDYNKKYLKHLYNFNIYCVSKYGYDITELKEKMYHTKDTLNALHDFEHLSPLLDNNSVMNMVCHYMESQIKEIKEYKINSFDYYTIMMDNSIIIDEDSEIVNKMSNYYSIYLKIKSIRKDDIINKNQKEDFCFFNKEDLKKQIYENVSSNESELCNASIILVYCKNKKYKKDFVWELFGEKVIENIINNTEGIAKIPIKNEIGDFEYLYGKYSFVDLKLKEE